MTVDTQYKDLLERCEVGITGAALEEASHTRNRGLGALQAWVSLRSM